MPGLFVTATGTDAGKTYVTAGLIRACRRAGQAVDALKPVISGFDGRAPHDSDTGVLLDALGVPVEADSIARVSPWRFAAPLSPDMAAALEGRAVACDAVARTCRAALAPGRLTIIEGVGGVMVPLEAGRTILDLMAAVRLPVVLVSPTALGAISHLLTALEALRGRDLSTKAIVLSESAASSVPLDLTMRTLAGFGLGDSLFALRRHDPDPDAAFDALLAKIIATLPHHPD